MALLDCGEVGGVAESGTNGGEGGVQADGREASGGGERTDMSDDKDRVVLVGTNRRGGRARGGDKRRWRDTMEEGVGVYEACMYEGEASGGGCSGGLGEAECGDDYPRYRAPKWSGHAPQPHGRSTAQRHPSCKRQETKTSSSCALYGVLYVCIYLQTYSNNGSY